ncbi:hypothetical protein OGAPHI_002342 [Ogataea philodendri]|uniref:Uncharacterized protein n=1 Tax=Ogataea philodendri TaxID=1378263 RepID=A0A9P8PAB1_9ASCO|nr:uncharacterized protein OGAPHI_002342 [Ogataea philodendri]KAH3668588.1 hypothetical protein OGAPHI_002342 [Ogataea philodendri]
MRSSLGSAPGRYTDPFSRSISPSKAKRSEVFPDPVAPKMILIFPGLNSMLMSLRANEFLEFLDQCNVAFSNPIAGEFGPLGVVSCSYFVVSGSFKYFSILPMETLVCKTNDIKSPSISSGDLNRLNSDRAVNATGVVNRSP